MVLKSKIRLIIFFSIYLGYPGLFVFSQEPLKMIIKDALNIWNEQVQAELLHSGDEEENILEPGEKIYLLRTMNGKKKVGYCLSTSAMGRYERFDYYIIYDLALSIDLVKVWNYRSSHGGAIAGKRWLRQFEGYNEGSLTYGKDVQAISSATISGNSITEGIRESTSKIKRLVDKIDNR